MRAVIYARFSSTLQRDASIEDQIRECRTYAKRQDYTVLKTYEDRAISGASTLTRLGLNALLRDAQSGLFDIVIVEALDRLSRSLADTAKLHDTLKFYGVEVQTISGGVVNTMQIGFMGTMNQMFLDELGKKTKRGQKGRVAKGRILGGLSYGYNMITGEERGKRSINPKQAVIVRRIFTQYAQGFSPRAIAKQLNVEGIPSPRGANGKPLQLTEMLNVATVFSLISSILAILFITVSPLLKIRIRANALHVQTRQVNG